MKSRSFNLLVILALFLSLLGGALTVTPARAASIVVNSNADNTTSDDNLCTLREAINNANSNSDTTSGDCAAGSGADTITFADDYTITLVGSQLPAITTEITITGEGAVNTIIQANAAANTATYRVLEVGITGTLTLDGVTVRHGRCNGSCATFISLGGGIFNRGTATLTNVTFSGNFAGDGAGMANNNSSPTLTNVTFNGNSAANGGGMANNNSSPTLTNVTFSTNSANWDGGGIYNDNGSSPTLTNVTFSNNLAFDNGGGMANNNSSPALTNVTFSGNSARIFGGGIFQQGGTVTVTNSTLSGNSAGDSGGGIFNSSGTSTITNSTLSGNSAGSLGGGVLSDGGTLFLYNTIIANSTGSDCGLSFASITATNSLIENTGLNACNLANGVNGNIIGVDSALGALADNGGPTQTHALLAGSPAIGAGDATTCANAPVSGKDQRGVTRPQGAGCDIGAYEAGAEIPTVTATNPAANATLASLSGITIVFNQDMLDNATTDGAENVDNYILVERGANSAFDTTSCAGGVVSDDVPQTISTASYNSAGFVSLLTLASPLTAGTYRLFVCGTTSIWSTAGLELNNGLSDYIMDFTITGADTGTPTTPSTTASALPATGFAPKKITSLPQQPADLAYAKLGDIVLEIPSLNVKSTIVGVPQNADNTWDVNWLGTDTGWLNGTAFPTWNGNSVLTAHVTNANGLEGPFAALKNLKYGEQIIVHMGGAKYIYEVRNTKLAHPYSTSYAFQSLQDYSHLTLITCQGYNPVNESYIFRRVVRAVLISVENE